MPAPTEETLRHLSELRRALENYEQMAEQLTVTQGRCTELLEENRRLRAELVELRNQARVSALVEHERLRALVEQDSGGGDSPATHSDDRREEAPGAAQGLQSSARCGGTEADSDSDDNQAGDVADDKGRPSPPTEQEPDAWARAAKRAREIDPDGEGSREALAAITQPEQPEDRTP